jgi:hypothetical protein
MERIKIQTIAAAAGALGRDNRRAAAEKAIEHDIAGVTRGLSEDIRFQSAFVCPRNGSFLTRRWREMDSNFQYASTEHRISRWVDRIAWKPAAPRNAVSPWEAGAPRSAASRWEAAANPWLGAIARCQAARYRAARRAAMRSAHCEIRPGENVTLLYLSHDGSPGPPPSEPPPPCGPIASASQSPL